MKLSKQQLRYGLLLVVALMLSACGASKDVAGDSSQSSRLTSTDTSNASTVNRPYAYCNQRSNSYLSVTTGVITDGEAMDLSRIYLKILKVPSYFAQNQNYIEFHKWLMTSKGVRIDGEKKLTFHIYNISTGALLESNKTYLYWSDLQKSAQVVGASTPEQFFKKVRFVIQLDDTQGEYDVVSTKYFDMNDNTEVKNTNLDTLIPVFDANPALYAYEKDGSARSSKLTSLHPFASYSGQGWSNSLYQSKANEFCSPLNSTTL